MKKITALLFWLVLATLSLEGRADMPDPDVLIKDTVRDVLAIVKQDKDIQAGNQKKILDLVDAKVLPHFNFARMTQLAVGKHWRHASPEQKQTLVAEFRNLLVRTYTKAFTVYRDQTVEVKPFKMAANATEVTVKTLIIKPGEPDIPVNYDLEKTADGWKAFDLTIEGVSLVSNYRSTFSDQIQQSGIEGLIRTLVEKNQSASSTPLRKAESK
ncbi:MAG: ABC transporter substrate-binding protein [Nitrosomonadales bacterium]|nr:ABC transporter substrate-binding protein [Nitrosomonadales bacterium]